MKNCTILTYHNRCSRSTKFRTMTHVRWIIIQHGHYNVSGLVGEILQVCSSQDSLNTGSSKDRQLGDDSVAIVVEEAVIIRVRTVVIGIVPLKPCWRTSSPSIVLFRVLPLSLDIRLPLDRTPPIRALHEPIPIFLIRIGTHRKHRTASPRSGFHGLRGTPVIQNSLVRSATAQSQAHEYASRVGRARWEAAAVPDS